MWGSLGIGLLEVVFLRAPSVVVEFTARGGLWVVSNTYNWYSPTISETKQLQLELEKIRFEVNELRHPEWVVVDKP